MSGRSGASANTEPTNYVVAPPRPRPAPSAPVVKQPSASNRDAWSMAQGFVKDYLKSPSTADFGGGVFSDDRQDPNECVHRKPDGTFVVSGWVDSQNAFGATVRTAFVVNLRYKGDRQWSLINHPIMVQR